MMNCKQVEKLLPLYVGHDLEAGREGLLTAHLESCAACSAAAGEFRHTRQMVQEFASPAFGEDVYAEIRRNVWQQIESESSKRSRWEDVFALFRPRWTTALATAALIAVSAFGVYFIANRLSRPKRIAASVPFVNPKAGEKEQPSGSPQDERKLPPLTSNETPGPRLADRRATHRRTHRSVGADQVDAVTVAHSTPPLTVEAPTGLDDSAQPDASSDNNSKNTLRMEIQTKNPNIRIIWFSQRDAKRVSPTSKGI